MRIGIDCRDIAHPERGPVSGIGLYVHHLTAALVDAVSVDTAHGDELTLFFDSHDAAEARHELHAGRDGVTVRVLPFRAMRSMPILRSHLLASAFFTREGLDVLHGPANSVPLFYRHRTVVTVHDLAVYDHPEWFPSSLPGAGSFSRGVVVPASVRRASRVIAVSEATRADVVRLLGVAREKIAVVHEAAAMSAPQQDSHHPVPLQGASGRYVLGLSTIEPRKNIGALAWAFIAAAKEGAIPADVNLVIAGARGWKCAETFAAIEHAQQVLGKERVTYLGPVSEREKTDLLSHASALAYPSLAEGFGLPPLEAMTLGTPVIASDAPSIKEVCGDAALYAEAGDVASLAHALKEHFSDPVGVAARTQTGLARAATFSWRKAARETMDAYRDAASGIRK
ncbi:MAG: hypothetical protein RLZZ324_386 [Candidatus Parcubacteria bacterium]|jgi:glycosyltransferase involved in cell wall biosynthesis